MPVLGVNRVGVSFGETVILKDVTFSVNAGEKVSKSLIKPVGRTGQASKKMIESYENGLK